MEDIPAGKVTSSANEVPSPKKSYNPIGTSSQWSFGWQGNEKPVFNRPNNSKGRTSVIQVSIIITTRAASSWESPSLTGRRRR